MLLVDLLILFCTLSTGKVGFEELKSELEKKKVLYVDVRNLTELKEEGKISGSYHIPC